MRRHDCRLHQLTEDRILYQVIETGLFINLRRRFLSACMVSIDHPMTAVYYKSMTARIREEIRHLGSYSWTIHPYSMVSLYWEFIVFIIYITQLITYTYTAAVRTYFREPSFVVVWKISLDYIMTIDIIKMFFTGYYDTELNKTVLHRKLIAKRYLKGYFLIDFFICSHSYLVPIRHLGSYSWTIHPYSMVSLYWEFIIFIIYITQLITYTYTAAVRTYFREPSFVVVWKISLDYIMTIDIIKMFFTGYYDTELNKTVLHRKLIAKRMCTGQCSVFVENTFILAVMLKSLIILRLFRLGRWLDAYELFRIYMDFSILNRIFRDILLYMNVVMFSYIIFFEVEELARKTFLPVDESGFSHNIMRSLYSATMILLHVNYGDRPSTHPYVILVTVVFLALGYCLQLLLYTIILQQWIQFSNARNKNENLFRQFTEYLSYKELPMELRKRFFSFFQFKYQNQYYNEAQINRMISKILRQEILVYVTKNHVQRVEFFYDLPDHVLIKIVSKLKSEIYLANDVIIKAGVTGTCMFFIYFGTVAIYAPSGKEICHLEDGAHFGEIALLYNEPRVASVVAVTHCELFVLKRSDFSEALEPYPEIRENISKLADERMRTIFHRK